MAEHSTIEWTDATWNPITGCSVVSPGCTNCYAMKLAGTRLQHHPSRAGLTTMSKAGPVWNGQVRLNQDWLLQPLQWKKPRRIFVCAHGDLFHENVPDAWIDNVFAVMALAPQHTFQVLTKRSARMRDYISAQGRFDDVLAARGTVVGAWESGLTTYRWPLPNVWLGVSAEDQQRADERIPDLLATPAEVRFISAEPLLGPIDLMHIAPTPTGYINALSSSTGPNLDQVIAGGESGRGARPMHPVWPRVLASQCNGSGVSFFFKQWGAWAPLLSDTDGFWPTDTDTCIRIDLVGRRVDGGWPMQRVGKAAAGRLLDGVEHNGMPEARA